VCEANLAGSFDKAARLLESLANLKIDAKRVQLITEGVGAALVRERDESTEAFLHGSGAHATAGPAAPLIVVTADGGRVQTRQPKAADKWKEDKVGVVYDALPGPEQPGETYHGPPPITRSVVVTMKPWEELADHLSALADRRGYAAAVEKVFISDGAGGIRSTRERCFPDAVFILDWAHAAEHLHDCAVARFGPGRKADDWYERQKERLWNGKARRVIAAIARLARDLGPPPPKAADNDPRRILRANLSYFRTNRDAMDYAAYRQKGWPLGSGIIESTIKQLGKRVKGTEKHWSLGGVEATLQVMALLVSEDGAWEGFWQRCPMAA